MVASRKPDPRDKRALLARTLKMLRRFRRRTMREMADMMGLDERTYGNFERGAVELDVAKIHRFAQVLDVDAYAILTAVEIGSPEFALRTADNKLVYIFHLQAHIFDRDAGDAITFLDSYTVMAAFEEMFAKLGADAERRKALRSRDPSDD